MKSNRLNFIFLSLYFLSLVLLACNLSTVMQAPTPDLVATSVHQTASALLAQAEQTNIFPEPTLLIPSHTPEEMVQPTGSPTPSPSVEPTASPTVEDNRILFAPGTTFATVRGEVQENTPREYVLQVSQGQMLSLFIESGGKTPALAISGADGKEILSAASGYTWYLTRITKTQDYIVTVVPAGKSADFILHVATPIDVNFDSGATAKTFQGMIAADDIVEFRAYAVKGQKARVTLNSISGQASLHIYGLLDLVNYVERKSGSTTWEALLTESQNYIIKVLANDYPTEFTLEIEFLNP